MRRLPSHPVVVLTLLAVCIVLRPAVAEMAYVAEAGPSLEAGAVVIDTRRPAVCENEGIENARCLSADVVLGPHGRLPHFRDVLWLLGASGLDGSERVLVVGRDATRRDFIAALLHIAGQARVDILARPVGGAPGLVAGRGSGHAMVRQTVFVAPMRHRLLVLHQDLASAMAQSKAPALVDGRTPQAYWGRAVRFARGGHIRGAENLPLAELRAGLADGSALAPAGDHPVAYGARPLDGLALMAALTAGLGIEARVYTDGWARWAADGALPADSETFGGRVRAGVAPPVPAEASPGWAIALAIGLSGAVVGAGAVLLALRGRGRRVPNSG